MSDLVAEFERCVPVGRHMFVGALRLANSVAHRLARAALLYGCWDAVFTSFPSWFSSALREEVGFMWFLL